jgi:hypothetical protein
VTKVATCRSCGAEMIWVTTPKGKKMPLDAAPAPKGSFIFDGDPEDAKVLYIGEKDKYQGERFTSHFSTCPDAGKFRKKDAETRR